MVKTRTRNITTKKLERLCRLPGEVAGSCEERAALRLVVDAAVEVVGVTSAHIALVDDHERSLYGVISSGLHPEAAPRIELHLSEAAAAQAALHLRKTIHVDRADEDSRVNPAARNRLAVGSVAYVPLLSRGESFGLLILITRHRRSWSPADLRLARYCADIASVALENLRLLHRLAESEDRIRGLIQHIPAITYTRDVEPPFRTHTINPEVEAILGYSPLEWRRDPDLFMKLIHPEDMEQFVAVTERGARGRGSVTTEYRLLDRRGETRWFLDEAVLVRDPAGHPVAWRGIAVDITMKRRSDGGGPSAPPQAGPPGRRSRSGPLQS
jgi:PAS domain S-box-containing protein